MVRMRYNSRLKHYFKEKNSPECSKEAICPHCSATTTYVSICPLVCSKCEEILPPLNEILKNHKAKVMWHVGDLI